MTADRPSPGTAANPVAAAALTVLASAFVAGTMLLAKALGSGLFGPPLHPLQVSQGRFLFALVLLLAGAAAIRPTIAAPNLKAHSLRVVFGWGGVTLMFAAAAFIPLSDATAISFLNPVVAMLLSIPLLGERIGRWRALAAGIAVLGTMILLRPTPEAFQPAALLALGAAVCTGSEVIVIKRLSNREAAFQILLINNLLGAAIATVAASFVWQWPNATQWLALAAVGGLMVSAQICFVHAIKRADASFVSPFWYATLVFAAGYDLIFFGRVPDGISILGSAAIVAGAGILAWREAQLRP